MTSPIQPTNSNGYFAFWVGGENLFAKASAADEAAAEKALEETRIRIGTLLKTETVSFLLGAGASVDCGGQLIGRVPLAVEQSLHQQGIFGDTEPRVRRWLKVFYLAVRHAGGGDAVPTNREAILKRREDIERRKDIGNDSAQPLPANFERVLSQLHRWRAALPEKGGRLRIDYDPPVDVSAEDLDACLRNATHALAEACRLPTEDKKEGLATFKTFLRKILTRPLNLKRVNIFTLNYDTLVEQAADAEGVVLLDGFVGTQRRIFRPESYEQDLYFPAETTEGRVHRFDRVVHLYKLHGSITWVAEDDPIENPCGVRATEFDATAADRRLLIYPTPAKYGEILGMPYSELFRRFAAALVRPQSVLFTIGYGFGDEHVNAIIRQALAIPSFTLVVVAPKPPSPFVTTLKETKDQRVWIAEGDLGKFTGFVDQILPDLREEDIRQKVARTQRALACKRPDEQEADDSD